MKPAAAASPAVARPQGRGSRLGAQRTKLPAAYMRPTKTVAVAVNIESASQERSKQMVLAAQIKLMRAEQKPAEEVLAVMAKARAEGLRPNRYVYSSAISAMGKHYMHALELLRDLATDGVQADVHHYTAVIGSCSAAGQWQQAVELLFAMPDSGVKRDVSVCNAVMSACAKSGQWAKVLELLSVMEVLRITPNEWSYSVAIDACAQSGRSEEAMALLCEAHDRGRATVIACNSAIHACSIAGQWQSALELLSLMPEWG
jgi:pentatricopeptide repeat domain-containing protein 1